MEEAVKKVEELNISLDEQYVKKRAELAAYFGVSLKSFNLEETFQSLREFSNRIVLVSKVNMIPLFVIA